MKAETQNTGDGMAIAATDQDWWRGAVIYQIYPRSFMDMNNDGIGDLSGVTAKMTYIASLGVDAIWLSPFFASPMKDFGYDISDYKDVDPMFGTLEDFDAMLAAAHAKGLKVIIDLVISHTSDIHPWFVESRAGRDNPKADWFVWANAKPDGSPPNNWLSIFGGPAWEWDTSRCQYYMHNFLASQPDLNFHNGEVQDAVLDAARFWLERGVDGFRLDTVNFYFHDQELRDNPPLTEEAASVTVKRTNPYAFQDHVYDKTRPENHTFLERLRDLLDEFPGSTSVGEIGVDTKVAETTAAYTEAGKRIHMAYSFDLLSDLHDMSYVRSTLERMESGIGSGWPSWAISNHDVQRVVSRWDAVADREEFAPLAIAMTACLRGTPCIYQGEELGLPEADVPYEKLQDPYGVRFWPEFKGRDGCRTPMPWSSDADHAGFSSAEPWLPVPANHNKLAVGLQSDDPQSVLNRTRAFLAWRKRHDVLAKGDIEFLPSEGETLVFLRKDDETTMLCAFNFGREAADVAVGDLGSLTLTQGHGFGGHLQDNGRLHLPARDAFFASLVS